MKKEPSLIPFSFYSLSPTCNSSAAPSYSLSSTYSNLKTSPLPFPPPFFKWTTGIESHLIPSPCSSPTYYSLHSSQNSPLKTHIKIGLSLDYIEFLWIYNKIQISYHALRNPLWQFPLWRTSLWLLFSLSISYKSPFFLLLEASSTFSPCIFILSIPSAKKSLSQLFLFTIQVSV